MGLTVPQHSNKSQNELHRSSPKNVMNADKSAEGPTSDQPHKNKKFQIFDPSRPEREVPLSGPTPGETAKASNTTPVHCHGWHAPGRGGGPELTVPRARDRLPGPPNSPDTLMEPQGSSQHRPTGPSASLELWACRRLPKDAIPQSWWHGHGRLRTTTSSRPPAPMGGARHLETVEAPQTPAYECRLVHGVRL